MLRLPLSVVADTLAALQESGRQGCEGIVIWLGRHRDDDVEVIETHHPIHEARTDMFHIPPAGMRKLQERLRESRMFVAAQVHSHPGKAFHSEADDRWAIVRHVGALSLVLPKFGLETTASSFLEDAKVFRLNEANAWREVPAQGVARTWLLT
jgi:proteasome lid subunit RPN8/RPN11